MLRIDSIKTHKWSEFVFHSRIRGLTLFLILMPTISIKYFTCQSNQQVTYSASDLPQTNASILFREVSNDSLDGILSIFGDGVPGWDHIALQYKDTIFEMHPGYGQGKYLSDFPGTDSVLVEFITGTQWQHTSKSFIYNSRTSESTPTVWVASIPIETVVAERMKDLIKSVKDARYQFIDHSFSALTTELRPDRQKGSDGSFTCVGLIEWAAEEAGVNHGQGFVPDSLERICIPIPFSSHKVIEIGTLSPQKVFDCLMKVAKPALTHTARSSQD